MARHNLNPNPAAKNNVTGWQQSGAAAPAQATGLSGASSGRTTGAKWTSGTYQTTAFGAASPGVTYTVSCDVLAASFNQSGRTIYLNFSRSAGGDTQVSIGTTSLTADTWARISGTAVAPANTTGVGLLLDGINASVSNVTLTAVLAEAAGSAGTYFDGDSVGGSWDGTNGNSASTLADAANAGSAAFTLGLAPAAQGARDSAGTTALGLGLAPAATGARSSAGSAALDLSLGLDADGSRPSAGSTALGLGLGLDVDGGRDSGGSAALDLGLGVDADGARASAGASAFALDLALAASGLAAPSGGAAFGLTLTLAATGEAPPVVPPAEGSAAFSLNLALAATGAAEISCLPFPWTCAVVPEFSGACADLPAFPGTCVPVPSFSEVTP